MGRFNFNEEIKRTGTSSLKWDLVESRYGKKDLLPMWVADMDFASPPEVVDALVNRAKHPVYGYTSASDSVYESVMNWMNTKHQWKIEKEWITFSAGVVSGFTTAILALSKPGDKVLVHSPVYTPFFDSIKMNDRELILNPLRYEDDAMRIDFELLEKQLQDDITLFLLCNPHNPGGMVWSKDDLTKIGELCVKYNVLILSDEIHADLCLPGHTHYPIASLRKDISLHTVTFMAPSKTFNVAGIQASIIISENKDLLKQITEKQYQIGFHGLNLFALEVIEACYNYGMPWLNELIPYLQKHIETVATFCKEELPLLKVYIPEASYLVWIDCRALGLSDSELKKALIEKGEIAVSPGVAYGPGGEQFIRINVGCTEATLKEGLRRLKRAFS